MSCLRSNAVLRYREGVPRRCGYIFGVANASLALPFDFCEHFIFSTLDLF